MATLGDLLAELHERRFVGRSDELRELERWLGDPSAPPILGLHGPGGIGKSWLVEAFERRVVERGRPLVHVDCQVVPGRPGALGEALTGTADDDAAIAWLDEHAPLIAFDALEAVESLTAELQALLARLDATRARILVSSRNRLAAGAWSRWQRLVRHVELGALGLDDQHRYLDLRGIDDVALQMRILAASGGHPLTLSLAADLAVDRAHDFAASPAWRSGVWEAVSALVADKGEPAVQALQVAAVLGEFDRHSLGAVLGAHAADAALPRLGAFSFLRRVGDRLALHDDVRRVIVEDLRLHEPGRLEEIRRRALRYSRRAATGAGRDEVRRRAVERLHLVGRDTFGMSVVLTETPGVQVSDGVPEDLEQLRTVLVRFGRPPGVPPEELDPDLVARLLTSPEAVVRVARDDAGAVLGYGWRVALSSGRSLLPSTGALASVLDSALASLGGPEEPTNAYYLGTIVSVRQSPAIRAALSSDVMHLLTSEGAYIAMPGYAEYRHLLEVMGFQPVPVPAEGTDAAASGGSADECQVRGEAVCRTGGRLLDLSRVGFEGWIHSLLTGKAAQRLPDGQELAELLGGLVEHFDDDQTVAASVVAAVAEPDESVATAERAEAAREFLRSSLTASGAWPSPELRLAWALRQAGVGALRSSALSPAPPAAAVALDPRGRRDGAVEPSGARTAGPSPEAAPEAPPALALRLLGVFELRRAGGPPVSLTGVVGAALKLVALRRSLPAEELIELLWPEIDPATGRDRLRNVLARLRRAAGPEVVVRRGNLVSLADGVTTDVEEFEKLAGGALGAKRRGAAEAAALAESAVLAYGGELLPADRFEEWSAAPRERLARLQLQLLTLLADECEQSGDTEACVRWLELAIEVEPYDEELYRRAARLLAANERRGRALAALTRGRAAAAALGLEASPELDALEKAIRSRD